MPSVRYRTLLLTLFALLFAFAVACGSSGGDDDSGNGDNQSASQQDGSNDEGNNNSSGGGSNSGNNNTGSGNSNNNSNSGNSGQSGFGDIFGGSGAFGEDACEAISGVSGIPGASIASIATDEPATDFGKDAASFFEDVLEDALGVDVSTSCVFDVQESDGDAGIWMAFNYGADVTASTQTAIQDAAEDNGATIAPGSTFFGGFGGLNVASVSLSELPFGGSETGAVIFVSDGAIVATAGSDFDISGDDPFDGDLFGDDGIVPGSSSGDGSSDPTPTPFTIDPGFGGFGDNETSSEIASTLESALESALGIELELEADASLGIDEIVATVSFTLGSSVSGDVIDDLTEAVENLGGTVTGTVSVGNIFNVQFEGGAIGGLSDVNGNFNITNGQLVAVITGTK